jgi:membrane protease YdiL (CAAX protease family)
MSTDATEKPPASDPAGAAQRRERRTVHSEILIVLGLSAFAWTAYALVSFAYLTLHTASRSPVAVSSYPSHFDPFNYANQVITDLLPYVPVFLVIHLFRRSGRSIKQLGLDYRAKDVWFGLALALGAVALAVGASNVGRALNLPIHALIPVNTDAHISSVVLFFLDSAQTAVAEEMIVNAYLLRRLDDLGWSPWPALLLSCALRGSYHVYQGWDAFFVMFGVGLVLGRIFQKTGRIVTPLVAHFAGDVIAFAGYFYLAPHYSWLRA